MRSRVAVVLFSLLFAANLFAKDVYLSISGKANGFFTDARILNPSFDKDITVTARYLPFGNVDNSGVASVHITVPKRTMKVFDDAVQSIFGGSPSQLGAIRLTSDDDFVATQRIYQDARLAPQAGTLGQFVPGLDVTAARTKGVLLQLKSGQAALGSFRTNWGGANPNAVVANVTLKLYDKNNAVVGTKSFKFEAFGVQGPTRITDYFDNTTADLTDAWISFSSDQPVFLYGSVVDNGSSDPTFVPASDDSGVAPIIPPPQQKTVTITAVDWSFNVTGANDLKAGDEVKFLINSSQGTHGFRMFSPTGQILIELSTILPGVAERIVTLPSSGTYAFLCTRDTCGEGHTMMNGGFVVGSAAAPPASN
jgi:hypothetical protein